MGTESGQQLSKCIKGEGAKLELHACLPSEWAQCRDDQESSSVGLPEPTGGAGRGETGDSMGRKLVLFYVRVQDSDAFQERGHGIEGIGCSVSLFGR